MDTIPSLVALEGTEILRFDAAIQARVSGQVDMVGANQFYMQRVETAAPGVFENKFNPGALCNGAGSRLGEADWNGELNAFLAEFMQTPEYAEVYQRSLGVEAPEFLAGMEGVPYTVTQ